MSKIRDKNGRFTEVPLEDRFEEKYYKDQETGCWEWTANTRNDYGGIRDGDQYRCAHRVSWELHNGEIPEGKIVCHHCDNPSCVNPNHLFIGTQKDNVQDMVNKKRHNFGEKAPVSKLTKSKVKNILDEYTGEYGEVTAMSEKYNVGRSAISKIVNGDNWKHVYE